MGTAKKAAAGIALAVAILGAVGYAYVMGIGPLEEDPAEGLDDPPETQETYDLSAGGGSSDSSGSGDGTEERQGPPFEFVVESVERCGRTCREIDAVLTNRMRDDAESITVYTWIYAGNGTDKEDVVWANNTDLGTLGSGESYSSSDRIELSPQQANNVRREGGLITIETTVESRDRTVRFVTREDAT